MSSFWDYLDKKADEEDELITKYSGMDLMIKIKRLEDRFFSKALRDYEPYRSPLGSPYKKIGLDERVKTLEEESSSRGEKLDALLEHLKLNATYVDEHKKGWEIKKITKK